jgi:bacterioferritin (cytochrome b1)
MGFDLDRSDTRNEPVAEQIGDTASFSQALSQNLLAERFAIDAYRKIAQNAGNCDKATLRLVKVALAIEEEHAEILSTLIENLRNQNGALAG